MTKRLQVRMMLKLVLLVLEMVQVLVQVLEQQGLGQVLEMIRNLEFHFVVLNHRPNLLVDIHLHFLEHYMHQYKMKMLQKDH